MSPVIEEENNTLGAFVEGITTYPPLKHIVIWSLEICALAHSMKRETLKTGELAYDNKRGDKCQ